MNGKEIDKIVYGYQQGKDTYAEQLLELFAGSSYEIKENSYLGKFYRVLRGGKIFMEDKDIRGFLALYIKDENARKYFLSYTSSSRTREIGSYIMDTLQEQYSSIPDEDLQQDLIMLFLQQATRYEKQKEDIYFTGYLYNSYRYALRVYLEKAYGYIYVEKDFIPFEEEEHADTESLIEIDDRDLIDTPRISFEEDGEFGNSWVRGLTCHPIFLALSPIERIILSQWYMEKKSDKKIAEMIGMNETTVFHKRKRAVEKLKGTDSHDEIHEL